MTPRELTEDELMEALAALDQEKQAGRSTEPASPPAAPSPVSNAADPTTAPQSLAAAVAERTKGFSPEQRERGRRARQTNAQLKREATIEERLLADPACHCGIRPDMTLQELNRLPNCKDPSFMCGTQDRVRRILEATRS